MRSTHPYPFGLACALALLFAAAAFGDKSFQTRGFFPCAEQQPPFDSSTCNHFTQYAAFVDLIGGGSSVQVLKLVGNSADPLINLVQNEDGTIVCPDGFGCTLLDQSETTIAVIRSPLPPGVPQVLPGDDVSIGFYWRLTRNNNLSPDNRLPYAYQVANCSGYRPFSTCEDLGDQVQYVEYNPFEADASIEIDEPECGAQCFGDVDLRGTCGPMVPEPSGWLSDSDGKCSEICCDSSNSVKIRQLGPFCYMFSAQGPPKIAVDFAVTVQNDAIGPDPVVVPVYGISDPQSLFVNQTGVRVRILSLIDDLERFDNANAFSVVHGSIVMCANQTSESGTPIFPDEVDGPVANVSDIDWFFVPSTYIPFYRDATAAEASQIIRPSSPSDTEHQKVYGEAGSVVEQAIVEYLNSNFDSASATAMCSDLSAVLPFVPGYDTDEPLTNLSPYELPSFCWMWNAAREANRGFLPPSFNLTHPNWYVRRGIPNQEQQSAEYDPNDLYLIYLPTLEQIEQADALDAFSDAMLLSVEINDNLMSYEAVVGVPAEVSQSPPPSCGMPLPGSVEGDTADGSLWFSVASTLSGPLDPGTPVTPIVVEAACQTLPGFDGLLRISPSGPVEYTIDYQDSIRVAYSVNITYNGLYKDVVKEGNNVAQCTITLTDVNQDDPQIVGPVPCQVGRNANGGRVDDDDDCSFCDLPCRDDKGELAKSACFWIFIVIGLLFVVFIAVAIWKIVEAIRGEKEQRKYIRDQRRSYVAAQERGIGTVERQRLGAIRSRSGTRVSAASTPGGTN